jgi:beta-glucosidase
MKNIFTVLIFAVISLNLLRASDNDLEAKADKLVSGMTLDEKLHLIHGCGFQSAGVPRLGLPPIYTTGSSMGLTVSPWPAVKGMEKATAFPATIMLAATWNREIAYKYGRAIAEELRARYMHILLAPGVNLYRNPLCGRNYEYMGEDPYLASEIVVPYIEAVQEVGVMPTIKHFVANNSDTRRKHSNSVVSERALREIYFPPYKAAVQRANCLGFMNSYNLVNGEYTGESKWLLDDILRKEWGFKGLVMSDWNSLWNPELAAKSGVDIEMPGGRQCKVLGPENLKRLLKEGKITMENINSKVKHIIYACLQLNLYSKDFKQPGLNRLEEHAALALETAREGIVLLKNKDNLLPVEPAMDKKVVVIGPTAKNTPTTGGGSGAVTAVDPISIWDSVKKLYSSAEYLKNIDEDKIRNADVVLVCVGNNYGLVLHAYSKSMTIEKEQEMFNKGADEIEGEGRERKSFALDKKQIELIEKCAALNPNCTVMITSGGGVKMLPWIDKVKSAMWLFYPGENGSQAAVEIMAGLVNPSGKLPVSLEKELKDNPAYGNLGLTWGDNGKSKKCGIREYWDVNYKEDVFLGYRYFVSGKVKPLFPFGFGLSYTTFKYSNLFIRKADDGLVYVSADITNTGKYAGREVVQLYVGDPEASVPRPARELKGFEKIFLIPGETKRVAFRLNNSAFSFWSPKSKKWTVEPGKYNIYVSASSEDIRLTGSVNK